ncbi:MAG TPA: alpha/beta hydrolase [Kofleriaceae bacterium]|nr:alpha/beta hydrolase [Kofleriaceae bacterium]
MIDPHLEAEYNNRTRIPAFADIVARWAATSARERASARAELDQPYGAGARQRFDLFLPAPGAADGPVLLYIHGGYWQLGSGPDTAFVARAFTDAGLTVAIPSYSLCPAVRVHDIIAELRQCAIAVWRRTGKHPVVAGHSAGGHLAAALLATRWPADVPADLVRGACAISGVFDLAPLIPTSMNAALRLDADEARAVSPRFGPPPPAGRVLIAAVGAEETEAFHHQSRALCEAWSRAGVETAYVKIAGTHHFDVVDELTRPASPLWARVVSLARRW